LACDRHHARKTPVIAREHYERGMLIARTGRIVNTKQIFSREEIATRVRELEPWFHNLCLNGVHTAPNHFLGDYPSAKWHRFAHALPDDLTGKSVLDIGSNAGFYAIEMKRRGAERVVAMEPDPHYLEQAKFAAAVSDCDIEFKQCSIYDVSLLREKFDIVLCMGVLYHLRYPLLALDLIRRYAVRELLVFQSMLRGTPDIAQLNGDYPFEEKHIFDSPGFPHMSFVERKYAGDPTNWWIPNLACAMAMLRSAGFEIIDHPEEEVFLCRPTRTESLLEVPLLQRGLDD
jgi:tRNA (mo5U34)-methyltransferase